VSECECLWCFVVAWRVIGRFVSWEIGVVCIPLLAVYVMWVVTRVQVML
jgi:hypothetical protein